MSEKISRKAEKRKIRKEKKQAQLEKKLVNEQIKFNVLQLLKNEQTDTKPNMAKFLKSHVQQIRCSDLGKISFWPTFKYQLTKIFVKFLDGHELIYDMITDGKFSPKFFLYDGLDEIKVLDQDIDIIEDFFKKLLDFKFVY